MSDENNKELSRRVTRHVASKSSLVSGNMGSQDPKQTRSQQGVQKIKAAVALHYDGQGAPSVAAKGFDHRAEQLIEDMKREGKLIHEDHELVRWLQNMEVGETIPENLYIVIAELIAFAWYLDGKNPPQWEGKVLNKKV